jgi:TetR/AcrR family transcriptional regulator, transcriptional repressor for nem operon
MATSENAREAILEAARRRAQAHGYSGLNLRDIAAEAGIKAASIYYHFPGKAELAAAVARRYWEVSAANFEALSDSTDDPKTALKAYPGLFRPALEDHNRMCLASFMLAEHDDLPDGVRAEVQAFADANVAWLTKMLQAACGKGDWEPRARLIYAAVAGAQLVARGRADLELYDAMTATLLDSGLIPR